MAPIKRASDLAPMSNDPNSQRPIVLGGIPVENESLKLDHKKSGDYTQTPDRHMSKLAASRSVLTQKPGMPYNALHGSMVSL